VNGRASKNKGDEGRMLLIEQARGIFEKAIVEHEPKHVFLMTSGGNDSIVPLHVFKDDARITAAVHIDTGIRVPETETHVEQVCEAFNLPLLVYRASENTKADGTPDPMDYRDIVKKHGFPGPEQHRIMYAKLKQRQVERLTRDYRTQRGDRIMLVTGVRKHESRRRMGTAKEIQRNGGQVWVAPVVHWTDEDMRAYREACRLPRNPVAENLGMSGECLCGAYAHAGELAQLTHYYPGVANYIREIERESRCPWGWESGPDHQWTELHRGQGTLGFTPLCTSCVVRGRA
jgi:3'-phosphoadenosine 5'-phosphosulfate sulfotransferase (PAPS reductase)/FAD synthetase